MKFNLISKIKKLDNILMQSISLVNRLIVIPSKLNDETTNQTFLMLPINQSVLYLNLIKFINEQQTSNMSDSMFEVQKALSDKNIKQNNQFIMELNVMMSKNSSNQDSLRNAYSGEKVEINWFHLLTKVAIHKSNRTIDCLLFALFKKISQLTPLLFGSLLGPYANQIHSLLLNKLNKNNDGQIITMVCELLCSFIENQPAFFQKLADLSFDSSCTNEKSKSLNSNNKIVEGEKSVLKAIFKFLSEVDKVTINFSFFYNFYDFHFIIFSY